MRCSNASEGAWDKAKHLAGKAGDEEADGEQVVADETGEAVQQTKQATSEVAGKAKEAIAPSKKI